MNALLARFFFGKVSFGDNEEYLEFQFKFLAVLLFSGAFFTALFLIGVYSGVNPIAGWHVVSMSIFTATALLLWLALRGHHQRFKPVAWTYEGVCLLEYTSAMQFVPEDELRLLWLFTNIPGVYILLGQRAGLVISVLTIFGLAFGNAWMARPYSDNALATALLSMTNLALFFHLYGARSISYFKRMRDANRKLLQLATHDMLTGVLNARAYYERCEGLIRLARRAHQPFAVLFIDLDHFKSINDTHGHSAGDIVLQTIAQTLAGHLRQSDALGRIGGEEFSVFLPNTDIDGALTVAEVLRRSVEARLPDIGERRLTVTASVGVAGSLHGDESMREIQQRADEAMYVAKATGRNRVHCLGAATPADASALQAAAVPG